MKNKFYLASYFICVLVVSAAFVSCSKTSQIPLDDKGTLSLAPDVSWALVTDPYATYRKNVGWDSDASGHCRKNEVLMVEGRSSGADGTVWYKFQDGFLPSTSVCIYSNRYKALAAVKE